MLNLRQSDPVMIEFWGGEPEESGPAAMVEAFNAIDPSVQAKYTRYVNDDTGNTQLDTALQGGSTIDVYQTYGNPRLGQRIRAGAALDLSSYIEGEQDIKEWTDQEPEAVFAMDGSIYAIATVRAPVAVLANQDLLESAGITIPDGWTTNDFTSIAQQLSGDFVYGTFESPDIARQTIGSDYWYKNDASESNFDHPAFRETRELHRGLIESGSAFPWTDVLARNLRVYQQNLFLTGQIALWPSQYFVLRYINDTEEFPHDFITTFLPLPEPSGVDPVYNTGITGNWITLNPSSAHQDAAWEFIKFRLTDGAQYYLTSGKQPAFPGTDEETITAGLLGESPNQRYDVEAFKRVTFDPEIILTSDTITIAGAEIEQIVQQLTDRYLIGEIDIDECMSEMKRQADEAIVQAGQ
jgi:multiple sugar transport system substrate-binding protein